MSSVGAINEYFLCSMSVSCLASSCGSRDKRRGLKSFRGSVEMKVNKVTL